MRKYISRTILFLFISSVLMGQDKTLTLNTTLTGNQTKIARNAIYLKPGFKYTPSNSTFIAKIDETMVLPANLDYLGSAINANDRTQSNTLLPVGTTQGVINVSNSGAAAYQIPIFTPSGIAGIQPNISIEYNSQKGNGSLGIGWDISGISAISRSPQTIVTDQAVGRIGFDANDRYSLDGNKLLALIGTYGSENTTYETEIKSFSKIESFGNINENIIIAGVSTPKPTGPSWFRVTTKEGKIIEYGNGNNSKFIPCYSTKLAVYAWLINKITDPNGNYMTFSYKYIDGTPVIEKIEYTGNGSIVPFNSLQFCYDTKSDAKISYINGRTISNSALLRKINVVSEGSAVRSYTFDYTYDNNKTHLNQVTETGLNNESLNSTIINWGVENTDISIANPIISLFNSYSSNASKSYFSAGDINGDGKSEIIRLFPDQSGNYYAQNYSAPDNDYNYYYSNQDYYVGPNVNVSKIAQSNGGISLADINGDGIKEAIIPQYTNLGYKKVQLLNVFSNSSDKTMKLPLNVSGELPAYTYADFNNDGYDEFLYFEKGTSGGFFPGYIFNLKNNGEDGYIQNINSTITSKPQYLYPSDFNSDGLIDVLIVCDNGYYFLENTGGNFITNTSDPNFGFTLENFAFHAICYDFISYDTKIRPGDFNGDGLTDFLLSRSSNWQVAINNGSWGFNISYNLPNITSTFDAAYTDKDDDKDQCIVTDFDHDGKSDLIFIDAVYHKNSDLYGSWGVYDYTTINWYKSNGTTFTSIKTSTVNNEDFSINRLNCTGDFDGDGREDIFSYGSDLYGGVTKDENYRIYNSPNSNYDGNLVKTISDGFNNKTSLTYLPLTVSKKASGNTFYSKGYSNSYPIVNIQFPSYCVSTITTPDGLGNISTTDYSYQSVCLNLIGRGFLGFATQTARNNTSNKLNITMKQWDYSNFMLGKLTNEERTISNVLLSTTENNYTNVKPSGSNSIFSYLNNSVYTNSLNGNTTTTTNNYGTDLNGNVSSVVCDYGDNFKQTTTYSNYIAAGSWIPNKPQQITVTKQHPDDASSFSSTTQYTYDITKGNITSTIEHFGIAGKEVTTNYTSINAWGLPKVVTTLASSEGGAINQTKTYTYSPNGRFITAITDGLGTNYNEYNSSLGTVYKTTSIINLSTVFKYNNFGQLTETTQADGNKITNTSSWASGSGPANALYYKYSSKVGAPWSKTWYDCLGRTLREETVGFNGISIYTDTKYNILGQVEQVTSYTGSTVTRKIDYTYYSNDGRLKSEIYNTGNTVQYAYSGNIVTITENGLDTKKTYDKWGNIIKVIEPTPGGTIVYKYYSHGKTKNIISPVSIISMTYDEIGNQKTLTDPNAGTSNYRYDATGRLTYQKDGSGNETKLFYDNLGRIDYKQNNNNVTTFDYDYYTTGYGIGQIKKTSNLLSGSYDSYDYDIYGRQINSTRYIDAIYNNISFTKHFDSYGNIDQLTYPGNVMINYQYDSYGNLKKVLNGSTSLWTLNNSDATKTNYTLGNGLITEKTYNTNGYLSSIVTANGSNQVQSLYYDFNPIKGLLNSREDKRTSYNVKESFQYDDFDRLHTWNVYNNNVLNTNASYSLDYYDNASGNIKTKTDLGTYSYNGTGPNALTSINTGTSYNPLNQSMVFNELGKVSSITEGTNKLEFTYGADLLKVKTVLTQNAVVTNTSYYAGLFEAKKDAIGNVKEYLYIEGGDGVTAVVIKQNGAYTTHYIHKDHLGSFVSISNSTGSVETEMNYDPWGRRRNPITWSFVNATTPSILTRGFTGHEHFDVFSVIDMNARIYDPRIGMFISPDNYIQAPLFSQNFNRYSYCFGNPLKYTDPDGNYTLWDDAAAMAIGGILNLGINIAQGNVTSVGAGFGYFVSGALAGETTLYCGPVAGAAVLGAGNSFNAQVNNNGIRNVDYNQVAASVGASCFAAMLTGVLAPYITPYISLCTNWIGNTIIQTAVNTGITNFCTGFVVGTGMLYINNPDDPKAAFKYGLDCGLTGLVTGVISGGVQGYKNTVKHNTNSRTDKWRTEPAGIQEQMALDAAKKGAGKEIMNGQIKDDNWKGSLKIEYTVKSGNGETVIIHYWQNPNTGEGSNFKFKNAPIYDFKMIK